MANQLKCHPAIAFLFLMCDWLPIYRDIPMVIRDGNKLSIHIDDLRISPEKVSQDYSLARNTMIREKRPVRGMWTRLKKERASKKILELMICVYKDMENKSSINWEERFHKWHNKCINENPEWKYSNAHSMESAYSRALKMWDRE